MANALGHRGRWHGQRLRIACWAAAASLLLVPLVAMQFDSGVDWTGFDFAFMATLIVLIRGGFEFLARRGNGTSYMIAAAISLAAIFLLIWVTGAVGIIGAEDDPANLMFAGVIVVALLGSALARFRPSGMAATAAAAGAVQLLIGVLALAAGLGAGPDAWPAYVIGLTAIFTALWLAAAALFIRARADQARRA